MQAERSKLHIPPGIRFECTGCGNCCMHWPVPATDEDVAKIPDGKFRRLPYGDSRYRGFTHTLEKRTDGKCAFLAEDNRCELHTASGIDAKPAMCKLFPYSFTPTPTGFYLYVSFASTGVLANSGRLLTEQEPELREQLALFQRLLPHVDSDWSGAQLIDGTPLPWAEYLELEEELLEQRNLSDAAKLIYNQIPGGTTSAERMPAVEASPPDIDKLLLSALSKLYWPDDVFSNDVFDLNARELMTSLVQPTPSSSVTIFGITSMQTFLDTPSNLSAEAEDLLHRWVYSRIFAKLYFGRSYAHLSLVAGLHHLLTVVALIRMKAKLSHASSLWDVGEILRTVERRMTQMNFSRESCSVLEILLSSPSRATRIYELSK